ncbi:MAG: hypothetical protein CMJ64_03720, partial [Planctomycetaceae bacterium]|nr:hypothetical protein [Planctomycetaceae bacterium]
VAPPGLCLFMLYHFRGFTPPATSFRPFGTSTKRNLTKTKGAFTLKFYAFYAFKVYTNSPEFHLVLGGSVGKAKG